MGIIPTHNPASSPALSLDRLAIEYGTPRRTIRVSPGNRAAFLAVLKRVRAAEVAAAASSAAKTVDCPDVPGADGPQRTPGGKNLKRRAAAVLEPGMRYAHDWFAPDASECRTGAVFSPVPVWRIRRVTSRWRRCVDACPLGRWLHGDAKDRYSASKSYERCVVEHARVHAQAGRVAEAINAGEYGKAQTMIANESAYTAASLGVGAAIKALEIDAALSSAGTRCAYVALETIAVSVKGYAGGGGSGTI